MQKTAADHDFQFYTRGQYYEQLTAQIKATKRGDQITLATMLFIPKERPVHRLMIELGAAAKRGVDMRLLVDSYSFALGSAVLPSEARARLAALKQLESCGGHYTITNQPTRALTNPLAGRSHIKFAAVNNYLYIGSHNLAHMDYIDLMVGFADQRIADWLHSFGLQIASNPSVVQALSGQDAIVPVDAQTNLLVDSGQPGQSIILDKAFELIDTAKQQIFITCQFFPNDITARHLAEASARGVKVTAIYNHPAKHAPFNLLHHGIVQREKLRLPASLFEHQLPKHTAFLHTKVLVTDQGSIIGSNNYVWAGVKFGTAEMALTTTDQSFGRRAIANIEQQLS